MNEVDGARVRAHHLVALGRYEEATTTLGPALAASDPEAFCLLARCHLELGRPEDAVVAAQRALAAGSAGSWPYRLLAIGYIRLGQPRQGLIAAEQAVRDTPDECAALTVHTAALLGVRQVGRAVEVARHNAAIHPEQPDAHLTLGQAYVHARRHGPAEDAYRAVLRLDPDNSSAVLGLADLRARKGRLGAAGQLYARAGAMDPKDARAVAGFQKLEHQAVPGGARALLLVSVCLQVLLTHNDIGVTLRVVAVLWPAGTMLAMALAAAALRRRARKLPPGLRDVVGPIRRNKVLSWGLASGLGDIVIAVAGLFLLDRGWPLLASAALSVVGAALVGAFFRYRIGPPLPRPSLPRWAR